MRQISKLAALSAVFLFVGCNAPEQPAGVIDSTPEQKYHHPDLTIESILSSPSPQVDLAVNQKLVINPNEKLWQVQLGRKDYAQAEVHTEQRIQRWIKFKSPGAYTITIEAISSPDVPSAPNVQQFQMLLNVQ